MIDNQTETVAVETGNELVIFDRKYTPAALFVPGTMDPLLDHIRKQVTSEVTDPTTAEGRRRIISLAMKVTRTKTAIDAARKQLVIDEKRRLAAIDAEGRRVWNALEGLAEEVRQPVTEYENREKARVEAHKATIEAITQLGVFLTPPTSADLKARLAHVEAVSIDHEEFTPVAKATRDSILQSLTEMLVKETKAETDRAELERLRQEEIEREQKEREERAAARAKAEAEAAAQKREEKARMAAEAERKRIEREAAEREAKIKAEAEAKEKSLLDAAREAAKRAEREKAEAVEKERLRFETELKAAEEAARKREADKAHRAKINREILTALVAEGLAEDTAKIAITAIAKGAIPHVRITY